MMHEPEKSDLSIVATKPANNPRTTGGGVGGANGGAKGNTDKTRTRRTPSRESVFPGLERVRERARQ
jgi:hypothetical protein